MRMSIDTIALAPIDDELRNATMRSIKDEGIRGLSWRLNEQGNNTTMRILGEIASENSNLQGVPPKLYKDLVGEDPDSLIYVHETQPFPSNTPGAKDDEAKNPRRIGDSIDSIAEEQSDDQRNRAIMDLVQVIKNYMGRKEEEKKEYLDLVQNGVENYGESFRQHILPAVERIKEDYGFPNTALRIIAKFPSSEEPLKYQKLESLASQMPPEIIAQIIEKNLERYKTMLDINNQRGFRMGITKDGIGLLMGDILVDVENYHRRILSDIKGSMAHISVNGR
jgi:hypothetical protein